VLVAFASTAAGQSVHVNQTIEWTEEQQITTLGGEPTLADIALHVAGLGPVGGYPVDCVLIIDTSATSDLSSAKSFAFDLIDRFSDTDRIAVVSYSTTARLDMPLTTDRAAVKTTIADLAVGGKSALGLAMQMARRELLSAGREDAILVEILLADGQSNTGLEPSSEAEIAAETGIHIVSVGIGNLINESLLQAFASETEGLFYRRPSTEALSAIERRFEVEIAASEIRIEKRLPAGLEFVSATPSPSKVEPRFDGTTSVVWRIAELRIGQEITIDMQIEAKRPGAWAEEEDSLLTYTDFRGVVGSISIPVANWPPMADFAYDPAEPTTSDLIEFEDLSEDTGDEGKIIAWAWEFGDGDTSFERSPRHRYPEQGTYEVKLTVVDDRGAESVPYAREIVVSNTPPTASFSTRRVTPVDDVDEDILTADRPRVGVEIVLDASGSYDLDDTIAWYLWDFDGDGVVDQTTEVPEVAHTFHESGEQTVELTVVDSEGARATVRKTLNVIATVKATRTIETGLPDDWTIPSGIVHVTLSLELNTTVNGLSVTETIPAGWELVRTENEADRDPFEKTDDDGATLRITGQTLEWLFFEKFIPDGVDSRRQIQYTLRAPATVGELVQGNAIGKIGSSSPRFSQPFSGDDRVTATAVLPVPVVISRWDVESEAIDPHLGEMIGFDQIQYAVSLWQSGNPVPNSGNMIITLDAMQDLIAYWLTGSSVHDPIP
jgi:PKD repeat protein